jgi:aminobenzoyl-glutamate utilization protein B
MTDTKFTYEILGSAWPGHFNKPMAEAMYENIKKVGLPYLDGCRSAFSKGITN